MKDNIPVFNDESPMVKRVRTGKLVIKPRLGAFHLKIPRKGRIRAILIIVLLSSGVLIVGRRETKAPVPRPPLPVKAQSVPVPGQKNSLKSIGLTLSRLNPFNHSTVRSGHEPELKAGGFSREHVFDLLKAHSPFFQSCQDTVSNQHGRYVVYYSIDTVLSNCGETLLKRYHPKYGALVVMEPGSGRVLSLVSYSREGEDSLGDNLYCQSIFPAASIFKTITAAGAIEKGHVSPESTFSLAGRRYTLYKFQLAPELRSFEDVSLADAFAMSINPVFGRIGIYVLGRAGLAEYMRKFGFNSQIPFDRENEGPLANENIQDSLLVIAETASGFNTVTRISPLFGALLASSIAEKGVMPVPSIVDSVRKLDSDVVYRVSPRPWRRPIQENTACELKELMMRVVRQGTARSSFRYIKNSAFFNDVEYGGKTGTVDEDELGKIDWFIGFARHKDNPKQRLAVGIVTVHDEFWTVHSSFIGEELFRTHIRRMQKTEKKENRILAETGGSPPSQQVAGIQPLQDSLKKN
jgi:penicillin-binding protein A